MTPDQAVDTSPTGPFQLGFLGPTDVRTAIECVQNEDENNARSSLSLLWLVTGEMIHIYVNYVTGPLFADTASRSFNFEAEFTKGIKKFERDAKIVR